MKSSIERKCKKLLKEKDILFVLVNFATISKI